MKISRQGHSSPCEQGFGDTIQFCRYVPLVAERARARDSGGPKATARADEHSPWRRRKSYPGAIPLPDFDIHCPLLSLPLAFGTRLETIPSATPYLRASSQSLMNWDTRLGPKRQPQDRPCLVWQPNKQERSKSFDWAQLFVIILGYRCDICKFAEGCPHRRRDGPKRSKRSSPFRRRAGEFLRHGSAHFESGPRDLGGYQRRSPRRCAG